MLFARLLRSPYPHARVLHIDDTRAREHKGVRALHLMNDIRPRENAAPTLSHVGAIVAAVAAVLWRLYRVQVRTRNLSGEIMRKLSLTESQSSRQFLGTVSRGKPNMDVRKSAKAL